MKNPNLREEFWLDDERIAICTGGKWGTSLRVDLDALLARDSEGKLHNIGDGATDDYWWYDAKASRMEWRDVTSRKLRMEYVAQVKREQPEADRIIYRFRSTAYCAAHGYPYHEWLKARRDAFEHMDGKGQE